MASNLHIKSSFGRFLLFFGKFWSIWRKKSILIPKSSQNINFQNGVETALRPLFKELWAISGFSKTRGFTSVILTQRSNFRKKTKIEIEGVICSLFFKIRPIFSLNSHSLTGLFCLFLKLHLKIQYFLMTSNPQLKSRFGHFLLDICHFFGNLTKKINLNPKKFKNINVQKWYQNGYTVII